MNVCFYFNVACIDSDVGDRNFICTFTDSIFSLTFKRFGVDRGCAVNSAKSPSADLLPNSGCSSLYRSLSGVTSGGAPTTPGNQLQAKIILLLILILFGFLNGRQISNENVQKVQTLLVHIGIIMVSAGMIYLAQVKPF